jgi:hypothetical protein
MNSLRECFTAAYSTGEEIEFAQSLKTSVTSMYGATNKVIHWTDPETKTELELEVAHVVIDCFANKRPVVATWIARHFRLEDGAVWILLDQLCRMYMLDAVKWVLIEYRLTAEMLAKDPACAFEVDCILEELDSTFRKQNDSPERQEVIALLKEHFRVEVGQKDDAFAIAKDRLLPLTRRMENLERQVLNATTELETELSEFMTRFGVETCEKAITRAKGPMNRLAYPSK